MSHSTRRAFLETCALGGATLPLYAADQQPALAIAHYKAPPQTADGIAEEAKRLTTGAVNALGGMSRFIKRGDVIWVKPNIGWNRRPEQAATTNPDVVATVVSLCYQAGAKRVVVSDNSCNAAPASFARSGIEAAAKKAGADVLFLDERKFRKTPLKGRTLASWEVYADILGAKLINVPIVKHHGLCKATLGMKNLMGLVGGERNRFHQNLQSTVVDLAAFLRPTLVVMDAVRVLTANGPVGGNLADVKRRDTVVAGTDQVAVDAFSASLLGVRPQEIGYITEAHARGLGTLDYETLRPRRVEI